MRERAPERRGGNEKPSDGLRREGLTLTVYAERYCEWLAVHHRTASSVDSKWKAIKPFLVWAEERALFYPQEITRALLEHYQRWIWEFRKADGQALAVVSQYGRLNALKNFFSWLARQRILEINPASELEMPKLGRPLPAPSLSIAQVESILAQPDITDPLGIRDRAILETLYSTAIRRTELRRLQVDDLQPDRRLLWIREGKGRKDRVTPVGQRALQWLTKYLADVRPLLRPAPNEQTLFLTGYGGPFNLHILSRMVRDYIRKAGIGREKGGCHVFRHACATHMLECGADIRYIQALLGHEKLDTTAIYTRVSITQLQAVHDKCHPAEHGEPLHAEEPSDPPESVVSP